MTYLVINNTGEESMELSAFVEAVDSVLAQHPRVEIDEERSRLLDSGMGFQAPLGVIESGEDELHMVGTDLASLRMSGFQVWMKCIGNTKDIADLRAALAGHRLKTFLEDTLPPLVSIPPSFGDQPTPEA